jgi:hypothetical protein
MYIQQNVLSHRERLSALAGQLKDCVTREVHLFSGLALDRLLQPPGVEYVHVYAYICMVVCESLTIFIYYDAGIPVFMIH